MDVIVLFWVVPIVAAIVIGNKKGRQWGDSLMFGAVLSWVGVLLVAVLPTPSVRGMRKLTCPRCDAKQNVPSADREYECWQCHQVTAA